MKLALTLLLGLLCARPSPGFFNVMDYGAKGDGLALDSPAVNKAISEAAGKGGGTVYFPAGTYVCGSIHLKSNIRLYLDSGCTLLASKDNPGAYDPEEDFPAWNVYQDSGHSYFQNSLIWGRGLENVTISGNGMIDGEGLTLKGKPAGGGKYGMADKAICLVECRNVSIRDVSIFRGGHFAILLTGCHNVSLDHLTIDTNRDGIDIDCCTFTSVTNCRVNSPRDDAICPKSSYALGRKIITENLVISDCQVSAFKMGTLLDGTMQPHPRYSLFTRCGRIKFGTESNGGFRNCTVTNCTFRSCKGLALEQVDGGVMENITISNLAMYDVCDYAIYIQLGERLRDPDKTASSSGKNIRISNVVAEMRDSLAGVFISGTPRFKLENISLSDITLTVPGGIAPEAVPTEFSEIGERYPELAAFKELVPSYGVYARHVEGLRLENINVRTRQPDARKEIITEDVNWK